MPRGRKKKIDPTFTTGGAIGEQPISLSEFDAERANNGVQRRLDEIEVRLLKLETAELKEVKAAEEKKVEVSNIPAITPIATPEIQHPVPSEFVDLIVAILNSKFTATIQYAGDRPEFMFTIVVPDEYTIAHPDFRSKVIANAEGINGVRDWVNKVYSSFDPETKAKIKATI